MARALFGVIAIGVLLASGSACGAALAQDEDATALPEGKGRGEVEIYCSGCHSLKLVTQQGLSRKDWDELLVSMVDEQGMEEMPADDRKLVLDYLTRHISVERVRQMRRTR